MARNDTTQLVADVIRDAKIPSGSSYRTPATLLGIASDEMEQLVVPEMLKVSGGHLMAYEDTALVAGQRRYRFPARAIRPERLQVVNEDGLLLGKLHLASGDMVDEVLAGRCPTGDALGYWTHENSHAVIVLQRTDTNTSGRQLRTYFRRQPNRLIAMSSCYKVVTFTPAGAGVATLEWSKEATGNPDDVAEATEYDFIKRLPPFECTGEDIILTAISDPAAEFSSGTESGTEAGDYFAPAGFSPFPQLPVALYGVLVAYTVARILRETGARDAARAALDEAAQKLASVLTTITPRGDEAETTVNDVWGV